MWAFLYLDGRKEFFRTDITEIESVTREITMLLWRSPARQQQSSIAKVCAWHCPNQLSSNRNGWQHRVQKCWMRMLVDWPRFTRSHTKKDKRGNVRFRLILLKKSASVSTAEKYAP